MSTRVAALCTMTLLVLVLAGCAPRVALPPVTWAADPPSPKPLHEEIVLEADSLLPNWRSEAREALWFSIQSPRHVGVFIEREADAVRSDTTLLSAWFEKPREWSTKPTVPYAYRIPPSWYSRALITLPDSSAGAIRITWLSYSDPDPWGRMWDPSALQGIRFLRIGATRLDSTGTPVEQIAARCPDCPPRERFLAAVVGRVTVDLATRRVTSRSGAVR